MSHQRSIDRSDLIDFLLSPSSYPHGPEEVVHIQTHASDVFIAEPYVYKVKKPVNLGFLDFSTLARRRYFCKKEVVLNRRLCEDTYIGVEEIKIQDGVFSFGGEGETAEYAVKMNRLPESMFLINMLREGKVNEGHFSRLSEKLVEFYKNQPPRSEILEYGDPDDIKVNIYENLELAVKFTDMTISHAAYNTIKFYNDSFFENKSDLFLKRKEQDLIKDCHGDLRLEHINFGCPDICIYDCIEFNDRFRYIDIASDIAFLAMDLDYNGYYGFSRYFLTDISTAMRDATAVRIMDFYKCYRAFVRGKVESIKALEPEVPQAEKALSQENAKSYFKLALRYAVLGSRPSIIVTFGMIASGKSVLASMLGEELSSRVISSDYVRKEITGTPLTERKFEGYDRGIYTEDVTSKTYNEIISRGMGEADKNNTVILDASFSKRTWRELLISEAGRRGYEVLFVRTEAPQGVLRERLAKRESEEGVVSDARISIFERFAADFEEPLERDGRRYFRANTQQEPRDVLCNVLRDMAEVRTGQ